MIDKNMFTKKVFVYQLCKKKTSSENIETKN